MKPEALQYVNNQIARGADRLKPYPNRGVVEVFYSKMGRTIYLWEQNFNYVKRR